MLHCSVYCSGLDVVKHGERAYAQNSKDSRRLTRRFSDALGNVHGINLATGLQWSSDGCEMQPEQPTVGGTVAENVNVDDGIRASTPTKELPSSSMGPLEISSV